MQWMNNWGQWVTEWYPWLMYGLLALVGLSLALRGVWAPLGIRKSARCGGCGHGVDSEVLERCPECGGAYFKVGLMTPTAAIRMRGSTAGVLIGWSLFAAAIAVPVWQHIRDGVWQTRQQSAAAWSGMNPGGSAGPVDVSVTLEPTTAMSGFGFNTTRRDPEEAVEHRIEISFVGEMDEWSDATSGTLTALLFVKGGSESTLEIDVESGRTRVLDSEGNESLVSTEFDEVSSAKLYELAGTDPTRSPVKAQVRGLPGFIEGYLSSVNEPYEALMNSNFPVFEVTDWNFGSTVTGGAAWGNAYADAGAEATKWTAICIVGGWFVGLVVLLVVRARMLRTV